MVMVYIQTFHTVSSAGVELQLLAMDIVKLLSSAKLKLHAAESGGIFPMK